MILNCISSYKHSYSNTICMFPTPLVLLTVSSFVMQLWTADRDEEEKDTKGAGDE